MKKHFYQRRVTMFCCCIALLFINGCNKDHGNVLEEKRMEDNKYGLLINGEKQGIDISKTLYGLFFEDINFAADGGLYAEKVINRSFEFEKSLAEGGHLHGYDQ